ncbi:MAG: OmpA family protein [Saccharospirillaceae bacterium]|nr:OmpA family protein [Pseudomonadales bacterium]NRB80141.1 OmpA family protein [Saccharospirillaceae bacterium]
MFVLRKLAITCLLFLSVMLNVGQSIAQTREFNVPIQDATWQTQSTLFECFFRQPIAQLGFATFYHEAGEDIIFFIESENNPLELTKASLTIEAPYWRPSAQSLFLTQADVQYDENKYVKIQAEFSRRMMVELIQGMAPTVTGKAKYQQEQVRIQVSPANFNKYYPDYQACQAMLLPVNFGQVQRNVLLFDPGKEKLNDKIQKQLDNIILYLLSDPKVNSINIEGHTDADGTRYFNRRLSEKRTNYVYDYLIKKGVAMDLIQMDYHGERYPVANNDTKSGKSRNRRVTIRLEREED